MLKQPAEKERAKEYFDAFVHLKKLANDATVMLAKRSKKKAGQTVNLSGRLRAVSQQLAAIYMLDTWGMKGANEAFQVPRKQFRESLDYLEKAPETDEKARKILQQMEKTYLFFTVMSDSDTFTPSLVVRKTDRMLKRAQELTHYYVTKESWLLKKPPLGSNTPAVANASARFTGWALFCRIRPQKLIDIFQRVQSK